MLVLLGEAGSAGVWLPSPLLLPPILVLLRLSVSQ
jgi:hypothetical protein